MHSFFFKPRIWSTCIKTVVHELFLRSAWVVLFVLGCAVFYERSVVTLDHDYQQLMTQYLLLQEEHDEAMALRSELAAKVNSQSDPAWIELTLMRVLGLAPEGQVKVLFRDEGEEP